MYFVTVPDGSAIQFPDNLSHADMEAMLSVR